MSQTLNVIECNMSTQNVSGAEINFNHEHGIFFHLIVRLSLDLDI